MRKYSKKNRRKGKNRLDRSRKIGQAIAAKTRMSGGSILSSDCHVTAGRLPSKIRTAPRVGIDYAKPKDRDALYRFIADGFSSDG